MLNACRNEPWRWSSQCSLYATRWPRASVHPSSAAARARVAASRSHSQLAAVLAGPSAAPRRDLARQLGSKCGCPTGSPRPGATAGPPAARRTQPAPGPPAPLAAVLAGPAQRRRQLAEPSGQLARIDVPRAAVGPQPPQRLQVAVLSGASTYLYAPSRTRSRGPSAANHAARWPSFAAHLPRVSASRGQPWARSRCRTSSRPASAGCRSRSHQVEVPAKAAQRPVTATPIARSPAPGPATAPAPSGRARCSGPGHGGGTIL